MDLPKPEKNRSGASSAGMRAANAAEPLRDEKLVRELGDEEVGTFEVSEGEREDWGCAIFPFPLTSVLAATGAALTGGDCGSGVCEAAETKVVLYCTGRLSPSSATSTILAAGPRAPVVAMWDGRRGGPLPNGVVVGAGAFTLRAADAAIGVDATEGAGAAALFVFLCLGVLEEEARGAVAIFGSPVVWREGLALSEFIRC
ncbi:hypothetical protein B0H16DRAFT_1466019 [Mycena metata]|uniref:Uncharacterized protein n=1 Tax=Mycena metata TaxID=1033252 RepID=A0AAD7MZV1_9AGAR|nr:hypothetical protein B0H16DRAFT_1466019 [Mycena metata]